MCQPHASPIGLPPAGEASRFSRLPLTTGPGTISRMGCRPETLTGSSAQTRVRLPGSSSAEVRRAASGIRLEPVRAILAGWWDYCAGRLVPARQIAGVADL